MAPSSGLIPLSGRHLFLVLLGMVLFIFVMVCARTVSFQYGVAQQMVDTELDALLRLRYEAFSSGSYRHFAEGLGSKLGSRQIQIEAGESRFHFGAKPSLFSACSLRKMDVRTVTLCSSIGLVYPDFFYLMAGLALALLMIRPLISYLERTGLLSLEHSLMEAGVPSDLPQGIHSLLVTTKESLRAVDGFKAREKVLAQQADLGEFAAKMAHDIRSPLSALTVISGHQALPADAQHLLKVAVDRIQNMAENLLDQFRGPGEESVPQSNRDIFPALENLIAEKRIQFHRRNPSLNLSLGSKKVFYDFSPESLIRVLSNLLNNAIEAVPDDRVPEIVLHLDTDSDCINFSVSDNGRGIPAHLLPELGRKGFTSGKEDGTGLGLYQVLEFLSSVGGHWDIASEPGVGTTITLSVPFPSNPGLE